MDKYIQLEQECTNRSLQFKKEESMKGYTSFRIGGPCRLMVFPETVPDVQFLIKRCNELGLNYFILGNGSNLLVSDDGYPGVIISTRKLRQVISVEDNIIHCSAGITVAMLCRTALDHNLTGLEFAFGIPAYVGGAAYMNAGAYGGEMKDCIYKCCHVDKEGEIGEFCEDELEFSYRHSVYSSRNDCITDVFFRLEEGDPQQIHEKMYDFVNRRKDKQPTNFPSAGSIFKRPKKGYAAALINECGLRGKQIGGAQVSEKHTGFIVNAGNATCEDVKKLIEHIQITVLKETGITLEPEVKMLG